MQPTRELRRAAFKRSPIWSCTRWGLPSFFDHPKNGALLPHHFTLTKLFSPYAICAKSERAGRYIFCCTFLRVTTTPRYGAPCPVVFGLSSGPCCDPAIVCSASAMYQSNLLPVYNPLTIRTHSQFVTPLKFIIHLRWNIDIASMADSILNRNNSISTNLL